MLKVYKVTGKSVKAAMLKPIEKYSDVLVVIADTSYEAIKMSGLPTEVASAEELPALSVAFPEDGKGVVFHQRVLTETI